MCVHVMKQKKCHYIGNCSFAHSLEERDVWTYMKNNNRKGLFPRTSTDRWRLSCTFHIISFYRSDPSTVRDMQQMYELWLQLTNQSRRTDSSAVTPPPDDKQVTISADYTESMVGGWFVALSLSNLLPVVSVNTFCCFREAGGCRTAMTSECCCVSEPGLPHQLQVNSLSTHQCDL